MARFGRRGFRLPPLGAPALFGRPGLAFRHGGGAVLPDVWLAAARQVLTTPDGSNNYNFSGIADIGQADPRRRIGLFFATQGGSNALHNALAVAGFTFAKIAQASGTANSLMLSYWEGVVATGASLPAPVLTCSAAPARCAMHAISHGRGAPTQSFGNLTGTGTIDVPAAGYLWAFGGETNSNGGTVPAWTGVDPVYHALQSGTLYNSLGGYKNVSGGLQAGRTVAPNYTLSPALTRLLAIALGPPQ